MKSYNVHKPNPTKEQALAIPLYVRSGKQVTRVLAVNYETRRVICTVEGSEGERTYDTADLVHHYGEAGVRHYLVSSRSSMTMPNRVPFTAHKSVLTDHSVIWEIKQAGSDQRLASAANLYQAIALTTALNDAVNAWAARNVRNSIDV